MYGYGLGTVSPTGLVIAPAVGPACTTCIQTNIPGIGTIDYSNPVEWIEWGAVAGALLIPDDTATGIMLAGVILFFRWQLGQVSF